MKHGRVRRVRVLGAAFLVAVVVGVSRAEASPGSTASPDRVGQPCAATGADPTRQAIHVIRGKARKLKQPENSGRLFGRARPDRKKEDQERNHGEIVRVSGYSAAVLSAGFVQSLGEFEQAGYVKVTVRVCNRDEDAQSYDIGDWRLQTPAGTVKDPAFIVSVPTLAEFEDLVEGGEVTGDVYFEVDGQAGDFFVIYKPDLLDASRGIWKVTI